MTPIVGIDLGTTNSLIGLMDAGFPILLADREGRRLTPSVVHFPKERGEGEGDEPLIGAAAGRLRVLEPSRTVHSVKRFMGRRRGEGDEEVPYPLAGAAGTPLRIVIDGVEHSPEAISARILHKLKADAEAALGEPVTRAVITVPAYFNDAQRNATRKAGELAGFTVERIVNEPTAAALAYGLDKLGERSRVAVFDLGGGTFDLSVLELSGGVFEVLSTHGNTRLGGDDIDAALSALLVARIEEALGQPLPEEALPRVTEAAIEAKHRLSDHDETAIDLPFLLDSQSYSGTVTREELETVALPILERTRSHCLRALADARLEPGDLNEVILVGGQTRMPLVRRFVADLFQREPNLSQNPDEAVALGATIQAGILSGAVQNVVLLDVTPLSLGIETFGGLMNVIIPRNSTIPTKAGEMFTNAIAGQRSVLIRVLQGEREMARDNWELGQFELEFDPAQRVAKGQARVGVQFEIDANGILHVLARDTKTGQERIVEMKSAIDVSDEAVEQMIAESLDHAFDDMSERVFTEARLKATEMLPAVRTALATLGSEVDPADRQQIEALMAEVEAALESANPQALKKATTQLDAATQTLATLLMERAMEEALKRRGVL